MEQEHKQGKSGSISVALSRLFFSFFRDETANDEAFRMNNSLMWFISSKSC